MNQIPRYAKVDLLLSYSIWLIYYLAELQLRVSSEIASDSFKIVLKSVLYNTGLKAYILIYLLIMGK